MPEELLAAIRLYIMDDDPAALLKYINEQNQASWEEGYSAGLRYCASQG